MIGLYILAGIIFILLIIAVSIWPDVKRGHRIIKPRPKWGGK
jgi:hypothetical protein